MELIIEQSIRINKYQLLDSYLLDRTGSESVRPSDSNRRRRAKLFCKTRGSSLSFGCPRNLLHNQKINILKRSMSSKSTNLFDADR